MPAEGDCVDVGLGVIGAEGLDADLGELAVTAGLGLLVPELGTLVPDLPRRGGSMLGKGAAHRRSEFRPEGEMLRRVALVEEVEHLLGDDVGRLAQPLEDAEVLEDRRHDLAEACEFGLLRERADQRPAATRLGRQDVTRALGGFEGRLGHEGSDYRPPLPSLRVFLSVMRSPVPAPGTRREVRSGRRRA